LPPLILDNEENYPKNQPTVQWGIDSSLHCHLLLRFHFFFK